MPEGRSRTLLWIFDRRRGFFLFVLAVFSLAVYLTLHAGGGETSLSSGFGDKIGVVDLDARDLSPQPVVGQLKKFADDSSIKAIILHVNLAGWRSGRLGRNLPRGQSACAMKRNKRHRWVSIETVGASGSVLHRHRPPAKFMPTRAASWVQLA